MSDFIYGVMLEIIQTLGWVEFLIGIVIKLFSFLQTVFLYKLSIIVFIIIDSLLIIGYYFYINKFPGNKNISKYAKYNSGVFDGIKYKWQYDSSIKNRIQITRIIAYCQDCECRLSNNTCPNCNAQYRKEINLSFIEKRIMYEIKVQYHVNDYEEFK